MFFVAGSDALELGVEKGIKYKWTKFDECTGTDTNPDLDPHARRLLRHDPGLELERRFPLYAPLNPAWLHELQDNCKRKLQEAPAGHKGLAFIDVQNVCMHQPDWKPESFMDVT